MPNFEFLYWKTGQQGFRRKVIRHATDSIKARRILLRTVKGITKIKLVGKVIFAHSISMR